MNQVKEKQNFKKWFELKNIISQLEGFQNFIVVFMCISLFCVMLIRLGEMFWELLRPINFEIITSDILFVLILVELFRLLVIYLQKKRISIDVAVEISLVSALREVILKGVLEIPVIHLLGICCFLLILAVLLVVKAWISYLSNPVINLLTHKQSVSPPRKSSFDEQNPNNIADNLIRMILPEGHLGDGSYSED
jgi:uncharacterized membrane protein (DUF373 family)